MLFPNLAYELALKLGLSWTLAYLFGWILVLLFSAATAYVCRKNILGHTRIWVPILAFAIPLAGYFATNPIYQGDFNKTGKVKDISENAILADVLATTPDFNGLVCVASPNCPYCLEAVQTRIQVLSKRNRIDVAVYLGFGDENTVAEFKERTDSKHVPFILNSEPDTGIDIDEPVIPIFLFIKDKKIVHLWRNDEMGYPALDWIEGGLK